MSGSVPPLPGALAPEEAVPVKIISDGVSSISVCSLGGGLLASGTFDETVRIWRASDGACLKTLDAHEGAVTSVTSLSAPGGGDSDLLASASHDKTVRIWRVSSGDCLKTLTGHEHFVKSVASLSAPGGGDSDLLASASYDKTVRIWRVSSGE